MIESPLIKEIVAKTESQTRQTDIEEDIRDRFGSLPDSARASLQGLTDRDKLRTLRRFANTCPTLEAFLERLAQETASPPAPVSSRRSRKR